VRIIACTAPSEFTFAKQVPHVDEQKGSSKQTENDEKQIEKFHGRLF
jgi:hypothetical protein